MLDVPPAYYTQATAYCLQGRMADGTWVRSGSVAHSWYPLGTLLTINGQRYVVRDRTDNLTHLDIWMPSCAQAIAFGRRTVKVRVGWWHKVGKVVIVRLSRVVDSTSHIGRTASASHTASLATNQRRVTVVGGSTRSRRERAS